DVTLLRIARAVDGTGCVDDCFHHILLQHFQHGIPAMETEDVIWCDVDEAHMAKVCFDRTDFLPTVWTDASQVCAACQLFTGAGEDGCILGTVGTEQR